MLQRKHLAFHSCTVFFSAVVVLILAVWFLLSGVPDEKHDMGSTAQSVHRFETVTGFFQQDDPDTDHSTFDYAKQNFGLIEREYDADIPEESGLQQWQRFDRHLHHLIDTAPDGVTYKLLYMGRHGEGFHNVGEAFYGTKAWDDYWSKLDGNGTIFWSDAHLTELGKAQALAGRAFLGAQFAWAKMPSPESHYVSPLYRCLQTADLAFSGLKLPADHPFKPVVKESLREVMGEHTCDRRSNRTYIHEEYPSWVIEAGFKEKDELWQPDHRETHEEHDARTLELLRDIFAHDQNVYLSFTSHSGAIASHLRVVGHREFPLPTGGMIPVLVKATRFS